jgi:hypothetical protein
MSCFIFHKWTKWESYKVDMVFHSFKTGKDHPYVKLEQRRTCKVCGKLQIEILQNGGY